MSYTKSITEVLNKKIKIISYKHNIDLSRIVLYCDNDTCYFIPYNLLLTDLKEYRLPVMCTPVQIGKYYTLIVV